MPVSLPCPNSHCGKRLAVDAALVGQLVLCPHCGQAFRLAAPVADDPAITSLHLAEPSPSTTLGIDLPAGPGVDTTAGRIGRFELRQRLGEGAFGVVYRAHDPQLDREVALKVAKAEALATPRHVERFLREARAAAQLRHPHIVPLFEAGKDGSTYYIAFAFIQGRTLAQAIAQDRPDFRSAAQTVRALAEALVYAHSQGIVHRDVKPANVMLDGKGEPLIMDFGLAARAEGGDRLTQEGAVMGTPAYMAPEQTRGSAVPASDQYSLGTTLYELLTGRPPFKGETAMETLLLALEREPVPPSQLNRRVPRDLETICLKCLRKAPAERYADCQALADDLRRWLEGEPIQARRHGLGERFVRWVRKEPKLAAAVSLMAAAVLGVALLALINADQQANNAREQAALRLAADGEADKAKAAAREAKAERDQKDRQQARAERLLYASQLATAQLEWDSGNLALAHSSLEACRWDFRGWEYNYLYTLLHKNQRVLGQTTSVTSVACSPDGKRIVSAALDKVVQVWDAATGEELLTLKGHTEWVHAVAYSPDGKRIASGSSKVNEKREPVSGEIKVWDAATGGDLLTIQGHSSAVSSLAFSPDGKRIVSGSGDGTLIVWDAATGREVRATKGHPEGVNSVAYSPDGQHIVSAGQDGTVKRWDAGLRQAPRVLQGHGSVVASVAYSPDGKRIVSGSADQTAIVWDAAAGQVVATCRGHAAEITGVDFSPDGASVVTAGSDNILKVWNAATGAERFTLKVHADRVTAVRFSPDGKHIFSGAADGELKVWDAAPQESLSLPGQTCAAFSPDGKRIVSAADDNLVIVWDAATGREILTLKGHSYNVGTVAFSPDGTRVLTSCPIRGENGKLFPGEIKVWDAVTGRPLLSLEGHASYVNHVAYSPDGRLIAAACGGMKAEGQPFPALVKVWEAATGRALRSFTGHEEAVYDLAFSPDSRRILSGSWLGPLKVWNVSDGHELLSIAGGAGEGRKLAFSPDGRRILGAGQYARTLEVWDADTGRNLVSIKGQDVPIASAVFSRDGTRIVTGGGIMGQFGEVRVWDAQTGLALLTLKGLRSPVLSVAFNADGKRLVTATPRVVKVWDANAAPEVFTIKGVHPRLAVSPDGRRIASSGTHDTGEVRLLDAQSGQEVLFLKGPAGLGRGVAFSPDSKRVVTSGNGGIKVWDAATGLEVLSLPGQHSDDESGVACSPDGKRFVAANPGDAPKVWDAADGRELLRLDGIARCVTYRPDGRHIAGGGTDQAVRVWDAQTGATLLTLKGHTQAIRSVGYSPDGKRIVSGSESAAENASRMPESGEVKVWDAESGRELLHLKALGHCVAFSPDGRFLATAGGDTVKLWDAHTGRELRTLRGHAYLVYGLAWRPDGKRLVTGDLTGTLKVWDTALLMGP